MDHLSKSADTVPSSGACRSVQPVPLLERKVSMHQLPECQSRHTSRGHVHNQHSSLHDVNVVPVYMVPAACLGSLREAAWSVCHVHDPGQQQESTVTEPVMPGEATDVKKFRAQQQLKSVS